MSGMRDIEQDHAGIGILTERLCRVLELARKGGTGGEG